MSTTQHKAALLEITKILALEQLQDLRENVKYGNESSLACPKYDISRVTDSEEAGEEAILAISKACHKLWPEHPAKDAGGYDRCPCFRGVPHDEVLRTIDGAIELKKEINKGLDKG